MKIRKIVLIAAAVVAIVLEILPFGAVLNFAPSPTETIRSTFSYFSLTPFGYANFGPFLTAILSCLVLALAVIAAAVGRKIFETLLSVTYGFAFATSLMPLMFGISYLSPVGAAISAVLLTGFVLSLIRPREKSGGEQ